MKDKSPEQTQVNIDLVHSMVEAGKSRRAIIAETKLPERFVTKHMQGATKGAALAKSPKLTKPNKLNTAAEQAYALAVRPQGCKDFELRSIAHSVYGNNYTKDSLYHIKQRCAELAEGTDNSPTFVPDWVCEETPTASHDALVNLALELEAIIQDKVNTFMEQYATGLDDDQLESTEAQRKQAYAARRHILKLAISEYSPEPKAILLERSMSVCEALENVVDVITPVITQEAPQVAIGSNDTLESFFKTVEAHALVTDVVEEDIFASVGVASAEQVKTVIVLSEQQESAHFTYLKELMSDDEEEYEFVNADHDSRSDVTFEIKGFDITKFMGGKSNAKGVEWRV
ncbi:hypothetical protein [Pseudomonas syringae]|uniref:hypothetical protein n=1 Tax=Pseudomonas syringae TaxID=317 RepID=UPI000EFBF975|nr:hypothetical protein [Pseudomonas syringae]